MIYLITEQKKAYWELICFVYLMLAHLLNVVYRSPEFLRKKIENYFCEVLSYTYWKTGNLFLTIVFIWQYKTKQIKAHLRHFSRDTTLAFRIQADPTIVVSSSYFYHTAGKNKVPGMHLHLVFQKWNFWWANCFYCISVCSVMPYSKWNSCRSNITKKIPDL